MKEAAVQRKHNLYRDSIVLTNSDPNLHLLGENPQIDWAEEFSKQEAADGGRSGDTAAASGHKKRRMKQVVSMIQVDGSGPGLPHESCMEVPGVQDIPEEPGEDAPNDRQSTTTQSTAEDGPASDPPSVPVLPNGDAPKPEKTAEPKPCDPENKCATESEQIDDAVQGADSEQGSEEEKIEPAARVDAESPGTNQESHAPPSETEESPGGGEVKQERPQEPQENKDSNETDPAESSQPETST